jgi:hypothetical protein
VTNNAGGASASASYSVASDTTAPTAPTPTVTAGCYTTASVPVAVGTATDAGSGVGMAILQRDQAALSATVCGLSLLSGISAHKQAKWGPPAGLTDVAGNGRPNSTVTAPASSGF